MEFTPSQLFYKSVDAVLCKYRYLKLSLNNQSSTSVQWQLSSSQLLQFKLSAATVFNLARSYLTYSYTIPAVAANYAYVHTQGLDFRTVSLQSQSGLPIASVENADMHVQVLRPIRTELSKYLTMDALGQLAPCNMAQTSNILPFSRDGLSAGVENASTKSYQEQQYVQISSALNTALTVNRYVPLSSLVDSVFSCDVDLCFGSDMILNLMTNYLTRMYSYTTTPNNPNANNTAPNANISVNNIFLHLACEDNYSIRNSLLNSLSSGHLVLPIPYTYMTRFSQQGNSSSFNQSLTITKAFGRFLKRIVWVPCNAQEFVGNYAYDHCNLNGSKVTQYQTFLNSKPQTDQLVNCYNPNSSHQDVFGMKLGKDKWKAPFDSNITDGIDLHSQGEIVYQIQAQTPALANANNNCYTNGLIHYVNQLFQRKLSIQPTGFSFDY